MMSRDELISKMKQRVYEANLLLPKYDLVKLTWGNVSEINRELEIIVIKPSGIPYDGMTAEQMVVTDLEGNPLEINGLNPSSDLATHVILYRDFPTITAIVHTHSTHSVIRAQAGLDVPPYGTTHADTFYGTVPCTRQLTYEEVCNDYEKNTGLVIVETFNKKHLSETSIPGVLVNGHGPFTWGDTPAKAVENNLILNEVCLMASEAELLETNLDTLPHYLLDKHYLRKHGENAYYGQ